MALCCCCTVSCFTLIPVSITHACACATLPCDPDSLTSLLCNHTVAATVCNPSSRYDLLYHVAAPFVGLVAHVALVCCTRRFAHINIRGDLLVLLCLSRGHLHECSLMHRVTCNVTVGLTSRLPSAGAGAGAGAPTGMSVAVVSSARATSFTCCAPLIGPVPVAALFVVNVSITHACTAVRGCAPFTACMTLYMCTCRCR